MTSNASVSPEQTSKIKVALCHRNYGSDFVGQAAPPHRNIQIEEWCQQHDITKASYYWRLRKVREAFLATAGNIPDFIEVPSSVIQSETIEPKHKTVAMIRGKNHLTFEITDQASASFLRTLLGVMTDAQ